MHTLLPHGIMDTASATSNGHRRRPYDRFIPFRPNLNVEESHAKLFSPTPNQNESVPGQYRQSGAKGYWRLLSDAFHERDPRILPMTPTKATLGSSPFPWSSPCLSPDEGYDSPLKGSKRKVATSPDCIMDMPGLLDDFCNNNLLASLDSTQIVLHCKSILSYFFQLYILQDMYYISDSRISRHKTVLRELGTDPVFRIQVRVIADVLFFKSLWRGDTTPQIYEYYQVCDTE